jgi:hypothetical protein
MMEIMKNFPNPDYETKKLAMALISISAGISERKEQEKNEILTEAREKLLKQSA